MVLSHARLPIPPPGPISLFYSPAQTNARGASWAGAFLFLRAGFQAFFAEEAAAARRKHQGEAANDVFRSEFRSFVSGDGRAETEMHPSWANRRRVGSIKAPWMHRGARWAALSGNAVKHFYVAAASAW